MQKYTVLGRAKDSLLDLRRASIAGSMTLAFWLLSTTNLAVADKIVIDGEQHEDVLISIGESLYYISFPKLGTTVLVNKSEVLDEDVLIESSGEKRSVLFAEWKLANTRLKEQREEEKRTKELEALETSRLRALAEQEKQIAVQALAREQIRMQKKRLGRRAAEALSGVPEEFAGNLREAEEAEKMAISAELDELENELKRLVEQSSDKSSIVIPERIEKRVEELAKEAREKSKLNSKANNEPGYSLEVRKAAMVTVLMGQGKSRSEAVATVEDMVKNDMLPDPPTSGLTGDATPTYVYSTSVWRAASIDTLIEIGWERSDAEIGVENIVEDDRIKISDSAPVVVNSVVTENAPTDSLEQTSTSDRALAGKISKSEEGVNRVPRAGGTTKAFSSERGPTDKSIEREVEQNWTPRPGGNTKEDAAWVARDIRKAKSWEELEEIVRFHDENGR